MIFLTSLLPFISGILQRMAILSWLLYLTVLEFFPTVLLQIFLRLKKMNSKPKAQVLTTPYSIPKLFIFLTPSPTLNSNSFMFIIVISYKNIIYPPYKFNFRKTCGPMVFLLCFSYLEFRAYTKHWKLFRPCPCCKSSHVQSVYKKEIFLYPLIIFQSYLSLFFLKFSVQSLTRIL